MAPVQRRRRSNRRRKSLERAPSTHRYPGGAIGWQLELLKLRVICNLRVPQDLAVTGFDDIPAGNFITPQLTTIHQPMAEKGRLAVASLMRENGPLRIIVPTKLIIRQSSDPSTLGSAQETEIDVRGHVGTTKNAVMKIAKAPPRRLAAVG